MINCEESGITGQGTSPAPCLCLVIVPPDSKEQKRRKGVPCRKDTHLLFWTSSHPLLYTFSPQTEMLLAQLYTNEKATFLSGDNWMNSAN